MSDLVGNPDDRFSRVEAHIKAENIDCGAHYGEAVLMSSHNLCFGSKVIKLIYPCTRYM